MLMGSVICRKTIAAKSGCLSQVEKRYVAIFEPCQFTVPNQDSVTMRWQRTESANRAAARAGSRLTVRPGERASGYLACLPRRPLATAKPPNNSVKPLAIDAGSISGACSGGETTRNSWLALSGLGVYTLTLLAT